MFIAEKNISTNVAETVFEENFPEVNVPEENLQRACDMSTQTDDVLYDDCQDMATLYCWQDSTKNEVSTQTFIPYKSPNTKTKIIEIKVPEKKPSRSIGVGPETDMRNGFQWFQDVKNDKQMKQLGGVDLAFFFILLNFIKPNAKGQPKYYKVMNSKDRLLLFLMKMKLGIPFTALSCIFVVSQNTARTIFYDVLTSVFEYT